eukprot:8927837-Pyramimonas_sp.AAC.1
MPDGPRDRSRSPSAQKGAGNDNLQAEKGADEDTGKDKSMDDGLEGCLQSALEARFTACSRSNLEMLQAMKDMG